ncbi:MAG: nucleotidyl transferase AbiEii/AbiGii toxin family protein [Propionibacteriaceae bacterium]|nr:nucleotidyl transferase AbiEii/AbiGii toxin family protein [Propionibacteriaceae bacterium]
MAEDQIRHDFVISHLLAAIARHADRVVFFGGTALSRTFLPDLRLSEDIDLLSVGARMPVAPLLDEAIRASLEPGFGPVTADPWLADARHDTDGCVFHVGGIDVKLQLIDGTDYTPWPTQTSTVMLRYAGLPDMAMTTLTPASFVCAKTWRGLSRLATHLATSTTCGRWLSVATSTPMPPGSSSSEVRPARTRAAG